MFRWERNETSGTRERLCPRRETAQRFRQNSKRHPGGNVRTGGSTGPAKKSLHKRRPAAKKQAGLMVTNAPGISAESKRATQLGHRARTRGLFRRWLEVRTSAIR